MCAMQLHGILTIKGVMMTDENREAFEKDATHLGYVCTMVGGKYSLYTNMAFMVWNAAIRWERRRAAKAKQCKRCGCNQCTQDGLRQERPGT